MLISGRIRALNNVLAEILRLNVHLRFRLVSNFEDKFSRLMLLLSLVALFAFQTKAQNPPPPPPPPPAAEAAPPPAPPGPLLTEKQLENLVARIALYPDPLLAQILTSSTYWNEIPEAAAWANEHNLQWDPSVLALIPFPSVLNLMAQDLAWTEQLGSAVLTRRADVMDAVQRLRKKAREFGYLRTNPYCTVVENDGYIEIFPVNPAYIYVPTYDPLVVFAAPRPGFFIGGAIGWGPAVVITAGFFPWGWAHPYFGWRAHVIFFDATPWGRVWANRGYYFQPYAHPWVRPVGPRVEVHPHIAPRP
jgi:hypothetical protein